MEVFEVYKHKRDKAMQTLAKLGAVKFVNELEMFHGRAGDGSPWQVKTKFNNAGNNSGNHNLYEVPGLYAGTNQVAKKFANARSRDGGLPEVHKIISNEDNAVVVNLRFLYKKLRPKQQEEYKQALQVLNDFIIPRGVVIPFEKRTAFPIVKQAIEEVAQRLKKVSLSFNEVQDITTQLSKNPEIKQLFFNRQDLYMFIQDFVGARNAKMWLRTDMRSVISSYMNDVQPKIDNEEYPISNKYISAWCANNGIIGCVTDINSVTLGGRVNDVIHIFDTTRIETERQHGEIYQELLSKYSKLSELLANVSSNDDINNFLKDANPREIMQLIKKDSKCRQLFQMNSGVWENWTVGQHTQAVLQFFEDNYKKDVLDEIIPLMKVVLLAHDAGKGIAFHDKISQEKANKLALPMVMNALDIKDNAKEVIGFLTGQSYTSQIVLGKDKKKNIKALCDDIKQLYSTVFKEEPTKNDVKGLAELAIILQTCDSGAYTRYAKIGESNGAVVGGGSDYFTASFVNNNGKPRLKVFEDDLKID